MKMARQIQRATTHAIGVRVGTRYVAAAYCAERYRSGVSRLATSAGRRVRSDSMAASTTRSAANPSQADGPTALATRERLEPHRRLDAVGVGEACEPIRPDVDDLRAVASHRRAHDGCHHDASTRAFDLDVDLIGEGVFAELDGRVPSALELGGHQEMFDVIGVGRGERHRRG